MSNPPEPSNPRYKPKVEAIFSEAPFIASLGIRLVDCGPGWCQSELMLKDEHKQQNGYVHAGVTATLADHTAGAAAGTLCDATCKVLTVEYKIHLLRPGIGKAIRCRAEVLRPGRTLSIVESEVFAQSDQEEKLIAKAILTMAIVQ